MTRERTQSLVLTTGGGTYAIDVFRPETILYITGTGALTGNWSITATGTTVLGLTYRIIYDATMTLGGRTINILGAFLTSDQALHEQEISCFYNGSSWDVIVKPNFNPAAFINGGNIIDGTIAGVKLALASITNAILAGMTRGTVKVGNSSGAASDLTASVAGNVLMGNGTDVVSQPLTQDVVLNGSGAATIQPGVVSNSKLAGMTRGSIKAGNSYGLADDSPMGTQYQVLSNNGSDLQWQTVDGDIIRRPDGNWRIKPNIITTEILTTITGMDASYQGIVSIQYTKPSDLKLLLNGAINQVGVMGTGNIILNAVLFIQTASGIGASTISVGVDSGIRSAGAVTNGILNAVTSDVAGTYNSQSEVLTYVGSLAKFGAIVADGFGLVTIQSSVDLSLSPIVASLLIYYLPSSTV